MDRNCINCYHFRRATTLTAEESDEGECRAHHPVVVVLEETLMSVYPPVNQESDCGEWKAAQ